MGIYFNPGNGSFTKDKNSQLYIDKTGLIEYLNRVICTNANCISVSHARRFGKSHAAGMIDAYYSRGCDSSELFADSEIVAKDSYSAHLNKYNVIHIDVSSFWDAYKDNVIEKIQEYIYDELKQVYGDQIDYTKMISAVLMSVYNISGIPFVIIIDEWDCVIRNGGNKTLVHSYLQFLHLLFKSEESKTFLALAYITGILPIKKIKDESALNNFREFTMLKSKQLTRYFGFTEDEVKKLKSEVLELFNLLQELSERYKDILLPGYTHTQIAMPSSFGLWFGAYAEALTDDMIMLSAAYRIADENPLGSAAGYGSSFPLDRDLTTNILGFDTLNYNSVAAGMSGGIAYVLDEKNDLYTKTNKDMVSSYEITSKYDVLELKDLIKEHVAYTNSEKGKMILDNFGEYLPKFKKIIPHDYEEMQKAIVQMEEKGLSAEQAQIEAFYANKK